MTNERNYEYIEVEGGKPIFAWTRGVPFEEAARLQVENVARLTCLGSHVAVMPDVHAGKGSTVGCVIPTVNAAIPAAVGVDIGCGMIAARTNLKRADLEGPGVLKELRAEIEARVPHGRTDNGGQNDKGAWQGEIPQYVKFEWTTYLQERYGEITDETPGLLHQRALGQLGTLGTGNHFIEVCVDTEDRIWIMLHSGSRGAGNKIGAYFTAAAKKQMFDVKLPDRDLSFLVEPDPLFYQYMKAVEWAQDYALSNRSLMLQATKGALKKITDGVDYEFVVDKVINCHHNYIAKETHNGTEMYITRKGAVRARVGDYGIIPGSMGARSFIVRGRGNPESFESCSHGAGRTMSRTQAKRDISLEQHLQDVAGVECRTDADVIDESPRAYKSIEAVMNAQKDLVEPVHELRQLVCVKG